MAKINFISRHIRDITKKDQEQSMSYFVTRSYLSYIWDLPHGLEYRVHPQVNNV